MMEAVLLIGERYALVEFTDGLSSILPLAVLIVQCFLH